MKGRKPKPTKLKMLAGNPGKRRLNEHEPRPRRCIPRRPDHLCGEAEKEWRRVTQELEELGLLSALDRAPLAAYCLAWGRWVEAERKVAELGPVLKAEATGGLYQNPWLAVANKAHEQMLKAAALFGMDPSNRGRIQALPPDEPKDAEARDYFDGSALG